MKIFSVEAKVEKLYFCERSTKRRLEELEKRLRGRGTEKEDAILRRLGNAQAEMDYGAGEGNFDCVLV